MRADSAQRSKAHELAIAATDRITASDATLGLAELELDAGRVDAARCWSDEAARLLAECEDPGQRLRTRRTPAARRSRPVSRTTKY
ncbi:hypothetical protein [Dactylosporangium sp. NPDC051484]|uniref:hypothetical protein n=1 Tax=Dactylosporangium sp. NPDC051484 TaxID=3154942 RepID=UPI003450BCB4